MKKQKKNKIISIILGLIFLGGGAFLIGSSVLLNISQEKENEILFNEIKDKKNDDAKTEVGDGDKTYSIEDCILRIPSIDSENVISEGTDKEALSKSLGHEIGTALPGTEGNCVIAGHRNYTFGKYFNRLDEVKVGDEIYIDTPDQTLKYVVSKTIVVEPDDVSILKQPEDEEILTLYTCTPIYVATHRLVVIARRV